MICITGRSIFERYSKLINLIYVAGKYIPNFIFIRILNIFDGLETKEALLLRYIYLKKNTQFCGDNIFIGKYVTLKNINNLIIGSNVSIQAYSYIDAFGGIKIGDDVSIANHTSLISFDHSWDSKEVPIKYNFIKNGEINIENDVWIGSGCRILSNVTIQNRSVIAAGAVVNKNVLSNSIFAGVPAKKIKEI